jgi:hypothetical protein
MNMRSSLFFLGAWLLVSVALPAQTPYSDDATIKIPAAASSGQTTAGPEPIIPDYLPVKPTNPLASATLVGISAHDQLKDILDKLNAYMKAKDFKKAGEAIRYVEQMAADTTTGKGKAKKSVPGLMSRMVSGGVDASRVNELRGKLSGIKKQVYSTMTARLLESAREHEGFDTRKGPGGGNVSCAWLMSIVLRAAGMVPAGWNENGAVALTQRLQKEYAWQKFPSTGKPGGKSMPASQMKPGDIVYWDPSDHVGVYLGDGMAMSNSSSDHEGTIHPVSGYYSGWVPRYVVRPPGSKT